jgi:hypothetical protein
VGRETKRRKKTKKKRKKKKGETFFQLLKPLPTLQRTSFPPNVACLAQRRGIFR